MYLGEGVSESFCVINVTFWFLYASEDFIALIHPKLL